MDAIVTAVAAAIAPSSPAPLNNLAACYAFLHPVFGGAEVTLSCVRDRMSAVHPLVVRLVFRDPRLRCSSAAAHGSPAVYARWGKYSDAFLCQMLADPLTVSPWLRGLLQKQIGIIQAAKVAAMAAGESPVNVEAIVAYVAYGGCIFGADQTLSGRQDRGHDTAAGGGTGIEHDYHAAAERAATGPDGKSTLEYAKCPVVLRASILAGIDAVADLGFGPCSKPVAAGVVEQAMVYALRLQVGAWVRVCGCGARWHHHSTSTLMPERLYVCVWCVCFNGITTRQYVHALKARPCTAHQLSCATHALP